MAMFSNGNDVFSTQADTRFNSFANPQNPVNQNSGAWGIDSNYLTPSYSSPFRPQYQGPNGNTYGRGSPSFGQAVNQTLNPFASGGANYGGNYWQQTSPYYDSLINKPIDAAASFAQNWAVPAAATFGAYKYLGRGSERLGGAMGAGMTRGMFGLPAGATGTAMSVGRGLGAMAGSIFLPVAAASAASVGFDSAIANPYIAQRQMGSSLRDNFSGVNFGEGVGDLYTGGGMSRKFAQNLAGKVSAAGARDMTFTQQETAQLTDMSSRAGLLDNTSASQMASRFEGIMKQVKVVMSIANTSDFKEAIEIMSKMQMSGVNPNQLSGAMGALSAMAGSGGLSMQKVMNTTGAQGQYMFGAAGLTPYAGMSTGFGASAAHSAAYRSGLISPAMMARMGGVEGAAQSTIAGTVSMYSSEYAGMMASNAYSANGGETGNMVSNVTQFGGRMASNPMQNIGAYKLNRKSSISKMIEERGPQGIQDMIMQAAVSSGLIKQGDKITSEVAYMVLTDMYKLPHDEAYSLLAKFSSIADPKTLKARLDGMDTSSVSALSKYRQQEGLDKGPLQSPYNAGKRAMMAIQESGSMMVADVLSTAGGIGDSISDTLTRTMFNVQKTDNGQTVEQAENASKNIKIYDLSTGFTSNGGEGGGAAFGGRQGKGSTSNAGLAQINKALQAGDPDAQAFMTSTGREKRNALDRLVEKGKVDKSYANSDKANELSNAADKAKTRDFNEASALGTESGSPESIIKAKLDKVLPGGTAKNAVAYIGLSNKIFGTYNGGDGKVTDEDRIAYAKSMGVDPETLTDAKMKELSEKGLRNSNFFQVSHLGDMSLGLKDDSTMSDLVGGIRKNGGQLLSGKIEGGDVKAVKAQSDVQRGIVKEKANLTKLAMNNKIDNTTFITATAALDNKETVGKFAEAVNIFSGAVNKDKGANGIANPNGVPSAKEYWNGARMDTNGKK